MEQMQCNNGHFFTPGYAGDTKCPHCHKVDMDRFKTNSANQPTIPINSPNHSDYIHSSNYTSETMATSSGIDNTPAANAQGKTVGLYSFSENSRLPVVGWLVCIAGPDRGSDFRIVPGRNFIGRDTKMTICLPNDPTIARDSHGIISFNPRKRSFFLSCGTASGLVFLNAEEVITGVELNAFDRIELGKSCFIFLPLCGEKFGWPEEA